MQSRQPNPIGHGWAAAEAAFSLNPAATVPVAQGFFIGAS